MKIPALYLDKIRAAYPTLALDALDLNRDGTVNDVVVVGGELVCRFPRHEWARDALRREARVLDLVRPRVPLPVPHFEHLEDDFAVYRFLEGRPLTRRLLLGLPPARRRAVLLDLGAFLRELHAITPPEAASAGVEASDAHRDRAAFAALHGEVEEVLYPFLMRHQRDFIDEHFAPVLSGGLDLAFPPALVHGDLGVYHVLYDDRTPGLSGVIDFGTAGVGDPATDFAALLDQLGESLVVEMRDAYPGLDALLDRARFWAGTFALQWALAGLKREDRSLLLAHLGGARDAWPVGLPRVSDGGGA